jgi:competence protein ComEC
LKQYIKWYFLILTFLVCTIVWSVVARETRGDKLIFAVLDVGQGDALFIESPTGVQVIIDGGPNNNLMREISGVLPWYDRHVDMIVITNPDRDHYEGFFSFLDKFKTDFVLKSGTNQDSELYKSLEQKIKTKNITEVLARRGQIIDIGGGAYLQILFPDRNAPELSSNDGSIVMRMVYGDTSVMLQGDSTLRIEEYLTTLDKEGLKSTILKTGHHGSRTSTGEEYVKLVDPEWAVISAGKDNSYGHPHSEVIEILSKQKVKILGTYAFGKIVFESDGLNFIQK